MNKELATQFKDALNEVNNIFGLIDTEYRSKLLGYLENPTSEGWNEVHGIILNTRKGCGFGLTVWQSVIEVDPSFPRTAKMNEFRNDMTDKEIKTILAEDSEDWTRIPSTELFMKAIINAVDPGTELLREFNRGVK